MSSETLKTQLLRSDRERYGAMMSADIKALDALLSDRLVYTHSTGAVENKAEYLAALSSRRVRYLDVDPYIIHCNLFGSCAVMQGQVQVHARVNGTEMHVISLFMSTWIVQDAQWQMVGWAATGLSKP